MESWKYNVKLSDISLSNLVHNTYLAYWPTKVKKCIIFDESLTLSVYLGKSQNPNYENKYYPGAVPLSFWA